jgi:DNA-binding response OmpR family regulator
VTALKGRHILLIDDDETIVVPFQLILQKEGYEVDTALNGRQALEKAGDTEYHMVISDVMLPDIRGIDIAKKIRKHNMNTRFIIMTGFPDLAESIKLIDVGIDEILIKPIEPDELIRAVKESLQ